MIDAAGQLFNEAGFHGTDSNRIARRAGYAPGTFYLYFKDKTDIFLAVYDRWVQSEWEAFAATLESGATGAALRSRLVANTLEHHRRWRVFRASLRALTATDDRVHAARVAQRERQIDRLAELIPLAPARSPRAPKPSRALLWSTLLTFEVLCDGIAEGDARALGIPEPEVRHHLERVLAAIVE